MVGAVATVLLAVLTVRGVFAVVVTPSACGFADVPSFTDLLDAGGAGTRATAARGRLECPPPSEAERVVACLFAWRFPDGDCCLGDFTACEPDGLVGGLAAAFACSAAGAFVAVFAGAVVLATFAAVLVAASVDVGLVDVALADVGLAGVGLFVGTLDSEAPG